MSVKILAVETATEFCSAALLIGSRILLKHNPAPREHSRLILDMVDELLVESSLQLDNIDALAYGAGPGSFTGLRIAASLLQGLAFGVNKSIIPISTLQALAQAAWRRYEHTEVLAILDARMDEIYYGFYQLDNNGIMRNSLPDQVSSPYVLEILPAKYRSKNWHVVGTGIFTYYREIKMFLPQLELNMSLNYPSALEITILAKHIFSTGGELSAEKALPIYIRKEVVKNKYA